MSAAGQGEIHPSGGYPKNIFDKGECEEKFLCNLCRLVLREPVQAYCGHRFCKSCIEEKIRSNDQIRCTQCDNEDQNAESEEFSIINKEQIFPDNAIRREMSKLKVVCANAGCNWKGTFKNYEEHVKVCEFKQIRCQNCGALVNEKGLTDHFSTSCITPCIQLCGSTVLFKDMQSHIDRECRMTRVACDLCGREIERGLLSEHQRTQCQVEEITCPVGCGTIARKDFQQHFHERKHEVWTVQELERIKLELQNLGSGDHVTQARESTVVMADKITAMEQQMAQLLNRQNESGTVAGLQIGNVDTKIRQAVELQLQSVNERLDVKTGTFEGIASALHRELEKTITAVEKLERHRREMESLIEQNQNKIRSLERSIALKDMNMAELELKAQSMEAASFDGTFLWRVSDFNKKHQDALHGKTISIYSPPFFTSRRGYKMCARLYPNGDGMGKGSHLSLFFVVMRGNYDALLKWPFSQRVTFCMINQSGGEHVIDSFRPDPQSSSFKRPTTDMNIASGCPLFIRLEMLQNPNNGFLKEDTLFLKVAVDVSDISDPMTSFDERIKA